MPPTRQSLSQASHNLPPSREAEKEHGIHDRVIVSEETPYSARHANMTTLVRAYDLPGAKNNLGFSPLVPRRPAPCRPPFSLSGTFAISPW